MSSYSDPPTQPPESVPTPEPEKPEPEKSDTIRVISMLRQNGHDLDEIYDAPNDEATQAQIKAGYLKVVD